MREKEMKRRAIREVHELRHLELLGNEPESQRRGRLPECAGRPRVFHVLESFTAVGK